MAVESAGKTAATIRGAGESAGKGVGRGVLKKEARAPLPERLQSSAAQPFSGCPGFSLYFAAS